MSAHHRRPQLILLEVPRARRCVRDARPWLAAAAAASVGVAGVRVRGRGEVGGKHLALVELEGQCGVSKRLLVRYIRYMC